MKPSDLLMSAVMVLSPEVCHQRADVTGPRWPPSFPWAPLTMVVVAPAHRLVSQAATDRGQTHHGLEDIRRLKSRSDGACPARVDARINDASVLTRRGGLP